MPNYYFIRVNGETGHNDPSKPECFVAGEPPAFPDRFFNYAEYCLRQNIVRIGWPAAGPLDGERPVPVSTPCYGELDPHIRNYLEAFRRIRVGDIILMPEKSEPGILYIGRVRASYHYFHQLPAHPFECAHRLGVDWDRQRELPARYSARELGITIHGDFWPRGFHYFDPSKQAETIRRIDEARR